MNCTMRNKIPAVHNKIKRQQRQLIDRFRNLLICHGRHFTSHKHHIHILLFEQPYSSINIQQDITEVKFMQILREKKALKHLQQPKCKSRNLSPT